MRYVLALLVCWNTAITTVLAQSDVSRLEQRVSAVEQAIHDQADKGLVLFLFGGVCALWAQNTKRNAWLWFFFGLFTGPIALIVLLWKNSNDRLAERVERIVGAEPAP